MAKGQFLSRHQRGIVRRYYLHKASMQVQKLETLTSDLALDPASDKLWARAAQLLAAIECDPPLPASAIDTLIAARSVERLAELVSSLAAR